MLLPLTLFLAALVASEETATCGSASYFPSEYTCHNNTALCPRVYGLPTAPCAASGGCYSPQAFSCSSDGTLRTLPKATSAFTLTAFGTRNTYFNQSVKACGGFLAIGANARECTSCRPGPGASVDCAGYGRKTVLLPDGSMAADVPGGQYWYVNPRDGVLQYTEAPVIETVAPVNSTGNGTLPAWGNTTVITDAPGREFAGQRVAVSENGFFDFDSAQHYWFACLRTLPGGTVGTGRSWRIYSSSAANVEFLDCEKIKLVAQAVPRKMGAYKYE